MSDVGPTLPQSYFVVHNPAGAVLRWGIVPAGGEELIPLREGEAVIMAAELPDMTRGAWISAGQILACDRLEPTVSKTVIAANGADEAVFDGLPTGCSLFIFGAVLQPPTSINATGFVLTSRERGEITVLISKPPRYGQTAITIHAR